MNRLKNFIINNKINLLLAVLYFSITAFTMFHHEIWRDEAQVWCIVRDLNLLESIKGASYEGHPFLWYLILHPFAKAGLPVISMQIISLAAVFASVLLFIFKSPFNGFFKTFFVFSAGMVYYLPVIARNYSLVPIFLFLIAAFYPKRNERPFLYSVLIILLSQTHILIFGVCAILFISFSVESFQIFLKEKNYKKLISPIIIGLNFLIMFGLFFTSIKENSAVAHYFEEESITFYETIQEIIHVEFPFITIILFDNFLILASLFVFIFSAFKLYQKNKIAACVFVAGISFIFLVLNNFWFGGILNQKTFLIFLISVFCLWIGGLAKDKSINLIFCFLFFISAVCSFDVISKEVRYNFSGGKEVANYIKNNLDNEETFIVVALPFTVSPISAYLPDKKLYFYQYKTYMSFYKFKNNDKEKINPPSNVKYLIVQDDYFEFNKGLYKEIFRTKNENLSGDTQKEIYAIYTK